MWPVHYLDSFSKYYVHTGIYGQKTMYVRVERRPLHVCVVVHNSIHTIHTSVFSFTIFAAIASNIVSNWK